MKKFLFIMSWILVLCILTSSNVYGASFSDVQSIAWYASNLNFLIDKEIVSGFPDGTFRPQDTLTREQFISLVIRVVAGKNFPGVVGNWSKGNLDEARRLGYIEKDGAKVNRYYVDPISRGEATQIVANVLATLNESYREDYKKFENLIKDKETIPNDMIDSVIRSYYKGIIVGYPDRKFEYAKNITRAESVAILYRIMNKEQRISVGELTNATVTKMINTTNNRLSTKKYDEEIDIAKTKNYIENKEEIMNQAIDYVEIIEYGMYRLLYRNDYQLFQKEYERICGTAKVYSQSKYITYTEYIRNKVFSYSGKTDIGYATFTTNPKLIYLSTTGTIRVKGILKYSFDITKSGEFTTSQVYEKNGEVELLVDKNGKLYAKEFIELK